MAKSWYIEATDSYAPWKVRKGCVGPERRAEHIFNTKEEAVKAADRLNRRAPSF